MVYFFESISNTMPNTGLSAEAYRGFDEHARLSQKTTTQGLRRTFQAGKRQAMLKGSGVRQHFLLSPQYSVLIFPDTRHLKTE